MDITGGSKTGNIIWAGFIEHPAFQTRDGLDIEENWTCDSMIILFWRDKYNKIHESKERPKTGRKIRKEETLMCILKMAALQWKF